MIVGMLVGKAVAAEDLLCYLFLFELRGSLAVGVLLGGWLFLLTFENQELMAKCVKKDGKILRPAVFFLGVAFCLFVLVNEKVFWESLSCSRGGYSPCPLSDGRLLVLKRVTPELFVGADFSVV